MSDNIRVKIGDPDTRSEFIIVGASGAKGYFTAGANRFEAYLNSLTLAQGAAAIETKAELNLGNVTNGIMNIAANASALVVGDTTHAAAYGLLELNGTPLSISDSVLLNGPSAINQSIIDVTVLKIRQALTLPIPRP